MGKRVTVRTNISELGLPTGVIEGGQSVHLTDAQYATLSADEVGAWFSSVADEADPAPADPGGSSSTPLGWVMLLNNAGTDSNGNIVMDNTSPAILFVPFDTLADSGGSGVTWDSGVPHAVNLVPGWYEAYITLQFNAQPDDIATAQYAVAIALGVADGASEPFHSVNPYEMKNATAGDPAFTVSWPKFRVVEEGTSVYVSIKTRGTTSAPSLYSPEFVVVRVA